MALIFHSGFEIGPTDHANVKKDLAYWKGRLVGQRNVFHRVLFRLLDMPVLDVDWDVTYKNLLCVQERYKMTCEVVQRLEKKLFVMKSNNYE